MSEDASHCSGCAEHSCQTCLTLEHVCSQITSVCGRQTPTFWQCSRVCELRTADQVAFYMWQSHLCATALPIDGLHLETGLHFNSFHGKIHAKSITDPVRINSSTAHTCSLTPQHSMWTNFEGPCFSNNTCMPLYPSREAHNWNFKMLHCSARSCIVNWQLAMGFWNSKVNACHIIHDLRYSKIYLKWVPWSLTVEHKTKRTAISSKLLTYWSWQRVLPILDMKHGSIILK